MENGHEARFLTPKKTEAKRPAWLAGSAEIAFNSDESLLTVDVDSGEIKPFLSASGDAPAFMHPCAYPGERAVVAVSFNETADGRRAGVLFKVTPEAWTPLTTFPEVCAGRPGVSPDGETIVFAGNAGRFAQGANQLWIVRPNEKPRRLEQDEPALAQGRAPRWSPDGKWIAFASTRPAPDPNEKTPKAVWVISAGGGEATRLTGHDFNPLQVAWSPDQTQLACGGFGCGLALLDLPERFRRQ